MLQKVLAVSHELQSEPQTSYTAVLPNPARNLSILAVEEATISLQWLPPVNSLLTEYNIRYKPVVGSEINTVVENQMLIKLFIQDEDQDGDLSPPWSEVVVVPKNLTTFVLKDLPPGHTILPSPSISTRKKVEALEKSLPLKTMLHSNPSFSPACKAAHWPGIHCPLLV